MVRGIGVAVSTSTSTALPLRVERQALVHAEPVLLVDEREREVLERDLVLEQRMGADQQVDLAARRAASACRCARAHAPVRSGSRPGCRPPRPAARWSRDAGAPGSRSAPSARPGARPRPRRRRRAARPPSCRTRRRPAAAAACAAAAPGRRRCPRPPALRFRQRVGQRLQDARSQAPVAGAALACQPAHVRAHQREGELPGEKLVIGQARPCRPLRRDVVRLLRPVQAGEGVHATMERRAP